MADSEGKNPSIAPIQFVYRLWPPLWPPSRLLKYILFADDTNVFLSHKSLDHLIEIMNSELIIIANWFKANRLSLNLEKTNFIVFSSLRKKLSTIKPLYINEIPIIQTRSSKFLGVIVDEHLTWRDHVLAVSNKIAKNIGVLLRVRHCLPKHILFNLYYTLIFPYLSYCNLLWGSNYKTYLNHLFNLQKRAIRIVCNIPWKSSIEPVLTKHNLLSLFKINKYQVYLFMYRLYHNLLPTSLSSNFQRGFHIHNYFTRFSHQYRSHPARLKIKQLSINCLGPVLWNSLPEVIRKSPSMGSFKLSVKKFIIFDKY